MTDEDLPLRTPSLGTCTDLTWDGPTPYSKQFGDLYYSADDPLGEIQHTFLEGVGFSDLLRKPHLAIGETGFGTGLNFLAAWEEWATSRNSGQTFTFVSVEAYPLTEEDLQRAHAPFPKLAPRAAALREQWPGAIPGIHRLSLDHGRVRLVLIIGEAAVQLSHMRFQADAWFLDGFAPAKNPDIWRPEVLNALARLSVPGAPVATFTAAGSVRRGLEAAGFVMTKRHGFGRKRTCLAGALLHPPAPAQAHWSDWPTRSQHPGRIMIVGDGIAARALAFSLKANGMEPVRIGGGASTAFSASTLPRALIAPKLVRGDQPFPVFWRQAYLDAVRFLDAMVPDVWVGERGVLIAPTSKHGTDWQAGLIDTLKWPEAHLSLGADGLWLPKGGALDPAALLAFLSSDPDHAEDIHALDREQGLWIAKAKNGAVLDAADMVILANGPGASTLLPPPADQYGLRIGAGHLRMMCASHDFPTHAVMHNGYRSSADADGVFAVGASVIPRQPLRPVALAPESDAALEKRTAPLSNGADLRAIWTGLRCDTRDHLPLLGPVQDPKMFDIFYESLKNGTHPRTPPPEDVFRSGLYICSGLGARGFQGAFLLADTLAAMLTKTPCALTLNVQQSMVPARFQARALPRV